MESKNNFTKLEVKRFRESSDNIFFKSEKLLLALLFCAEIFSASLLWAFFIEYFWHFLRKFFV